MKSTFRILATTDSQPSAQRAADRAFRRAAETGVQLTLMHTIRQRVIDELHAMLGGPRHNLSRTSTNRHAPAWKNLQPNWGKHGRDMVAEFLLDSDTKHMLAESQCDVLVVT
ncbi:MAG: universal stress protein [Rhodocyclaceae bacterium]|nr:universal stress protein [Rhodocyclaceae bacterium]